MYKQLSFSSRLGVGRVMRESVAEVSSDDSVCPRISHPRAAVKAFRATGMHLAEQEEMWVIGLDNSMHVRYTEMVYRGTANMMCASPRDLFRMAIREGCLSVFVAHNHPSGLVMPSAEDKQLAGIFQKAGELVGVDVADCFVLSGEQWLSFKERGFLQPSKMGLM